MSTEISLVYPNSFEFKSDNGNYFVEGILEVADYVDSVNDVVTEDCIRDMAKQIKGRTVSSTMAIKGNEEHEQHFSRNPTIVPKAKIVNAEIKSKNLFIRVQLNKHHTEFKNLWGSIENGFIDAFSMEFKPKDYALTNINGTNVRVLNKVQLGGVALTGKPACEACKITDFFVKSKEVDNMSNEDAEGTKPVPDKKDDATANASATQPTDPDTGAEGVDEVKSQLAKITAELEAKDKELTEIKSTLETTKTEEALSKDEIKSMITEAVDAIKVDKPLVGKQGKQEVKSAPETFVDMIVSSKFGSDK